MKFLNWFTGYTFQLPTFMILLIAGGWLHGFYAYYLLAEIVWYIALSLYTLSALSLLTSFIRTLYDKFKK